MSRKTTLFEIVARLPWLTGVVLAAVVYLAQKLYLANPPAQRHPQPDLAPI